MPSPPAPFWANEVFWLYVALLLPYALCLIFYGFRSPRQKEPVGQALLAVLASLVAVLLFAVVALSGLIGPPLTDVLRFVLLGAVMAAGWWLFAQIVRLQAEARRCRKSEEIGEH